jgi:glycine/D-amino acid oxidase-like deaminating enzyme
MKQVEFFIIGNGLAGTLLAFEMLKNNLDFRIIASREKSRASEVAAGMINPLVFKRLTKSWMVDDLLPVAKKTYQNLEEFLGEPFYFEKRILKPLSTQEKELWLERNQEPDFSDYIFSVDDSAPIENVRPAAGFAQVNGSGYVALSLFLKLADNYFRSKNLIIDTTLNFQQINPSSEYFEVEGVKAPKMVFCEGAHIRYNPLFQWIKMVPVKGEVLLIHAPLLSEEFILNKKVFVLPVGEHRFKVGSTYEWNDLTDIPTEKGKISIVERLENIISAPYEVENQWAGIRPATADRRPALGVHPEYKNIFVFNGLGTKGVMLAPYFAKEMTSLLTSKNFEVNPEVNSERFLSGNEGHKNN